jgi:hypothetical protein
MTAFQNLQMQEPPETTYLEIIGKSHHENIWSRILAFYFDPKKRHGMKDMMLRSLFESTEPSIDYNSFKSCHVKTELPTPNGRLDLFIESSDFVVGIENKVNATLYNDLVDYAGKINALSQKRKSFLLVLSKNNEDVKEDVKEKIKRLQVELLLLTYEKFLASIRRNIGFYHSHAETKYFIFFLDFINNIEKNLNTKIYMLNDQETMNFFISNNEVIKRLNDKLTQLEREKKEAINQLDSDLRNDKQWIHEITSLFSGNDITILQHPKYEGSIYFDIKFNDLILFKSTIGFEEDDHMWCGYSEKLDHRFISLFPEYRDNVIRGDDFELWLYPWLDLSVVKKAFTTRVKNCATLFSNRFDEVKRIYQAEIAEKKSIL